MFFEPLSKCSWWFINVFLIRLYPVTFISIDDSTSLLHGSWSLGAIRRFLMVVPPLKYTCTPWLLHTFWSFHWALCDKEQQCVVSGYVSSSILLVCCCSSFGFDFLILFPFCWGPMQGIYIWLELCTGDLLPFSTVHLSETKWKEKKSKKMSKEPEFRYLFFFI